MHERPHWEHNRSILRGMTLSLHHKLSAAFKILAHALTDLSHHLLAGLSDIHLFFFESIDVLNAINQRLSKTLVGPDRVKVDEGREALLVKNFYAIFAKNKRRACIPIQDLNAQI